MERTNEELKDELLRVYRYTFGLVNERDRQRDRLIRLKREVELAKGLEADAVGELKIFKDDYNKMVDENCDMARELLRQDAAISACLDLVGAVISDEADLDDTIAEFRAQDALRAPLPGPAPVVMGDKGEMGSAFCLSCNGEKGYNYYMCEECFEINVEHDLGLFTELSDAWDRGDRDFPRPGKNAKLIKSEPRDI